MIKVREVKASDRPMIEEVVRSLGDEFVVSKGRKSYPQKSPGFIAVDSDGSYAGLLSYEQRPGNEAEITLFEAAQEGKGTGSKLMHIALKHFKKKGFSRVYVTATNNNYQAFKFYQYSGFKPVAIYPGAMKAARRIKPSIPKICSNGLPINDEIEYSLRLKARRSKNAKRLAK